MKKRIILILVVFLTAFMGFAEGQVDGWDRVVTMAGGRGWVENGGLDHFKEKYNITFEVADLDETTGEAITMPALIAAGEFPDIYVGFIGRMGTFMRTDTALPLEVDESKWDKSVLDTMRVDGKLLGLPHSLPVQAMAINVDILERAGVEVPDADWDIYEYLDICEAIKQLPDYAGDNQGDGVWPTLLYFANKSADYFNLNWLASFGVELFADNDYSRSAINDTEGGVNTFKFLQHLKDEGYTPPDSGTRKEMEMIIGFGEATVAMAGYRPNWVPNYINRAIQNGVIDEPFNYVMRPFPVAPGVSSPPPMPGIGTGSFAHITDNPEKAQILTEIVEYMMSQQEQHVRDEDGNVITDRRGVPFVKPSGDIPTYLPTRYLPLDEQTAYTIDLALDVGFMDPGYAYEWYNETRAVFPDVVREMYAGEWTPEEAAAEYERRVNEILEEYAE